MKSNSIEISKFLKKKLFGKKILVNKISSLDNIKNNSLIFLENQRINIQLIEKLKKKQKLLIITNSKNKLLRKFSYI